MNSEDARRHESVDHVHPTDAGLMDPSADDVPGTGIMGDETIVHDLEDGKPPGIYPDPPAHTGGVAHPGPTPAAVEDEIEQQAHRHQNQAANPTRREGT
jgi:hypothetical protein